MVVIKGWKEKANGLNLVHEAMVAAGVDHISDYSVSQVIKDDKAIITVTPLEKVDKVVDAGLLGADGKAKNKAVGVVVAAYERKSSDIVIEVTDG
jgi:hypothetical protein